MTKKHTPTTTKIVIIIVIIITVVSVAPPLPDTAGEHTALYTISN